MEWSDFNGAVGAVEWFKTFEVFHNSFSVLKFLNWYDDDLFVIHYRITQAEWLI